MPRIFSGWWVLLGLLLIYTANNGILIHSLPLFYPELIKEFGWNEEQVTRPASLFFVLAAILTPIIGAMLESNLVAGSQDFPQPLENLTHGMSITDKCIDWATTEALIKDAHAKL